MNRPQTGANSFKIIQTSKGRRKLVVYFKNWETTLKALDTSQVFLPIGKELKWLKKAQHKLKAKNTPNKKKSGKTGKISDSNQLKKKDKQQSLTKRP